MSLALLSLGFLTALGVAPARTPNGRQQYEARCSRCHGGDAASGKVLWEFPANQIWRASPMAYMFDNRQYITIAAGQSIMAFALPE